MNPIVTAVSKAFDAALAELVEIHRQLLDTANSQRLEMLGLIGRMQDTQNTLNGVASVCTDVAEELVNIAGDNLDIATKIAATLDSPTDMCPSIPYEDLVGFCDDCGSPIDFDDHFVEDDDGIGIVCEACAAKTSEAPAED